VFIGRTQPNCLITRNDRIPCGQESWVKSTSAAEVDLTQLYSVRNRLALIDNLRNLVRGLDD